MRMCSYIAVLSLAALAITLCPTPATAETWTLTVDQSVERALAENRDIAIAKQRLAEVEGIKDEARSEAFPQITGNAGYLRTWRRAQYVINGTPVFFGTNNNYTAGAGVTQLLWDGGRVFKAVKAARTELARGIETIRDAEQQIRLLVKQTFYQILYTDKMIDVMERELKQLKLHLSSIQTRFQKGIDSDYTLMRQEVAVANIEPELLDAKRTKDLLTNDIKILLAIPPQDEFVPAGKFDYVERHVFTAAELSERAKDNRPDLAAEKLREKSLIQNVGVEKAGWWPNFTFNTNWQWQAQSNNWGVAPGERTDSLTSGVSLSWPLFDGLRTAARVEQAKAQLMQQHYLAAQKEDSVVKEVLDASDSLATAKQALQSQRKSFELARRATAIAGERFESGLMSQLELNDTITDQAKAEQLYLQATFNCLTAEAALEKAVGGELWNSELQPQ
jgi:outer membrane protein TolC